MNETEIYFNRLQATERAEGTQYAFYSSEEAPKSTSGREEIFFTPGEHAFFNVFPDPNPEYEHTLEDLEKFIETVLHLAQTKEMELNKPIYIKILTTKSQYDQVLTKYGFSYRSLSCWHRTIDSKVE